MVRFGCDTIRRGARRPEDRDVAADGGGGELIRTIRSEGYMFTANVVRTPRRCFGAARRCSLRLWAW